MNKEASKGGQKRVFLVDGNSYLYRAFYATPHLSNSRGVPTNAIYAFVSMIKKLRGSESPDSLIIVFDSKSPSFREEIFREYKAQRPSMPDNLILQIPYVKEIIRAMGLPILERESFEADDIIATVVEHFKSLDDVMTIIVTSDKDMMQLVGDRVRIFDSMKNLFIGEVEVIEKFGVKPKHIVDYLSLCGDSSDNIPGVPGIGEKTTRELVSTMGSIEAIYANIDAIKRRAVKEKLISGKDKAELSKKLATLKYDVPVETSVASLSQGPENLESLRKIFRELEFTSLYREIKSTGVTKKEPEKKALADLETNRIAVAATFQGKNAGNLRLEGFAVFDGKGVFFSTEKKDLLAILSKSREIVTHDLKPFFILAGNAMRDKKVFDTMLAAYLVNPMRKDNTVRPIMEEYLDIDIPSTGTSFLARDTAPYLIELARILSDKLSSLGLSQLFFDTEIPLITVLAEMESDGVRIDRAQLAELSRELDRRLTAIVKEIYSYSEGPFNINSPQQLSRVLFETLGLSPVKKTKTGFSTDTEVLDKLSMHHPLPRKILEYRTLTKLKNTYIDVLPTLINPRTGRIHTTFNQMVTATGRLSSSDPNLQNIPIRGEEGIRIRRAFIPDDGHVFLSSDYSQIELRVLAHLSMDNTLIETFHKNGDIHSTVAQSLFGVSAEGVTQDMRRAAKVVNFGIIYGMSPFGLAKELGITQREAQHYIDEYFDRHRLVRRFMDTMVEEARTKGFVRTILGRMRFIPELNNNDPSVRLIGERAAMNTPIQGTAADIIKMAMIAIHRAVTKERLSSKLILQIHDELLFEVREDEADRMEDLVRREMEGIVSLAVPLKVSIGIGRNWAEAHS